MTKPKTQLDDNMMEDMIEAIRDADNMTNLSRPYKTAKEAVDAMLDEK